MAFRYSAFTVMMPEYEPATAAALLHELGYDGVEWRVHAMPSDAPAQKDFWRSNLATVDVDTIVERAPEVKKLSDDHGLEIVGLGTYLNFRFLDDVKRCMEAARIMGAPSIRTGVPKYDGSENYNDLYEEALDCYAEIETLARQFGVRANVEIHKGGLCPSASLAYRLVSNFDPDCIGVIYDPGNMVFEGYEKWQMGLELLGPYLSYVHVKNAGMFPEPEAADGSRQWKGQVVPMNEGIVQWKDLLYVFNRLGYSGWMSFEDFSPGDTREKLQRNLQYMKSLEAELGIQ